MVGFDAFEEPVVDGDEGGLVVLGGVVALTEQHGHEGGAGGEVDAGLALGLEGAVELRWGRCTSRCRGRDGASRCGAGASVRLRRWRPTPVGLRH
jgi:hypothetical protein